MKHTHTLALVALLATSALTSSAAWAQGTPALARPAAIAVEGNTKPDDTEAVRRERREPRQDRRELGQAEEEVTRPNAEAKERIEQHRLEQQRIKNARMEHAEEAADDRRELQREKREVREDRREIREDAQETRREAHQERREDRRENAQGELRGGKVAVMRGGNEGMTVHHQGGMARGRR